MTNRRTTSGLAMLMIAGTASLALAQPGGDSLPDEIVLTGKVRDFIARTDGGHTDFQWRPSRGFGQYVYMVADELDEDGKPVMASTGRKLRRQWKDAQGRIIMPPRPHYPSLNGDRIGYAESAEGGALHSPADFAQWFRDVEGVNVSTLLPITLKRQPGTNIYTFDDKEDPYFQSLGGFFPINNELYGNYQNTGKNFHFTFELDTEFVYKQGTGQVFTFTGDDDVWVFIDGKCVIDIGGVHAAVSQTVDLDRLDWLVDGQTYSLKFFFAERHTTQSNFRIETTLNLKSVNIPTSTALAD